MFKENTKYLNKMKTFLISALIIIATILKEKGIMPYGTPRY